MVKVDWRSVRTFGRYICKKDEGSVLHNVKKVTGYGIYSYCGLYILKKPILGCFMIPTKTQIRQRRVCKNCKRVNFD